MLISLVLVATVLIFFWIYARYKLNYWKRCGIESLPTDLIFGNFKNAMLFRSPPGWHIGQLYKAASPDAPFLGFYIFHKPCLLLRDPDLIKQIMIRDFDNFSNRYFSYTIQRDSIGMKNLFGLRNPLWKYLRCKITPFFTRSKLKQMLPMILETARPMMKYLKSRPTDNDNTMMIDVQEFNNKHTIDLIASIAFGTKTDSFHYPDGEFTVAVAKFFHGFRKMIVLIILFFIPDLMKVLGKPILIDSSFAKKIFLNALESREKSGEKRHDFIDKLLQLKNGEQNPHYKFEGDNLLHQCGIFFGMESSSSCLSFVLMELAHHPEYQDLARQDIIRAISEHGWTYEAFNDMKYLDRVIAENLRLHPPLSFIDRYALEDYQIPGTDVIIEKGTPVYISLYGMHTDSKFFDEAYVFNPDRFTEDNQVNNVYMPFGIGPKKCIGLKLAQLHIKVILSMLLREYEVWQKEENESSLDPRSTFTIAENGIRLHIKKIDNVSCIE